MPAKSGVMLGKRSGDSELVAEVTLRDKDGTMNKQKMSFRKKPQP